jgi:hypothetical protein
MDNGFILRLNKTAWIKVKIISLGLLFAIWQKDRACLASLWKYLSVGTISGKKKGSKLVTISRLLREIKPLLIINISTFLNLAWQ